jgi:hypothetical protein
LTPPLVQVESPQTPEPGFKNTQRTQAFHSEPEIEEDAEVKLSIDQQGSSEGVVELFDTDVFSTIEPPVPVLDAESLDEISETLPDLPGHQDWDDAALPDVDEGDKIENLDNHLAHLAPSTKTLMSELFRANYIRHIPPK